MREKTIDHICDIVSTVSFKGAGVTSEMKTLEGKVVRDADRLDVMGAIGIARTLPTVGLLIDPCMIPLKNTSTIILPKNT